jgi:hypothetical protein
MALVTMRPQPAKSKVGNICDISTSLDRRSEDVRVHAVVIPNWICAVRLWTRDGNQSPLHGTDDFGLKNAVNHATLENNRIKAKAGGNVMVRVAIASLVIFGLGVSIASAVTAPKLPASAKKLTGAEISALFNGATMTFESYAHPNLVTGTATFDLNNHTQTGTWEAQAVKKKGDVKGFVEVKGDQWCFKPDPTKEFCNFVYKDGADIYEVSSSNVVVSKEKKQ